MPTAGSHDRAGFDGDAAADRDLRSGRVARGVAHLQVRGEALERLDVGDAATRDGVARERCDCDRHVDEALFALLRGDDHLLEGGILLGVGDAVRGRGPRRARPSGWELFRIVFIFNLLSSKKSEERNQKKYEPPLATRTAPVT
jgi:hypothetical protein